LERNVGGRPVTAERAAGMEVSMSVIQRELFGNPVWAWVVAVAIAGLVPLVLKALKRLIVHRLAAVAQRTTTPLDDLAAEVLGRTKAFFLVLVAIYAGSGVLILPDVVNRVVHFLTVLALLLQVGIWGSTGVSFWMTITVRRKAKEDPGTATTMSALGFLMRLALWTVILLLTLDNLGVDITALVAGVGIGGIAVALAVQNILGSLFASLSIVLDKPFVIGDFIVVGELMGTVEHIGLRTTRVRSISGEQIVLANDDLLESRIRNYKRMSERRVVFTVGVTYQTPREKLAAIPGAIRECIEAQELARFDRSHFKQYGPYSLDFETVYYMLDPDYTQFMNTQQAVNLALHERFEQEGIEFAYPTQTVFVVGSGSEASRNTVALT
jgi:small-conductance mechanosensitive channel